MRTKPVLVASIVVVLALPLALAADDAAKNGDAAKIQGTWAVVTAAKGGSQAPDGELKDAKLIFAKDSFTWKAGDHEMKGTFKLDPTQDPKHIGLATDGMMMTGIYALEGDNLKVCMSHGDDRPTEFATKEGVKTVLFVLKREKP